ncbi:MAG: TetR/AcrR family transcriptional regulator [Acidimicrobiales bacterium]
MSRSRPSPVATEPASTATTERTPTRRRGSLTAAEIVVVATDLLADIGVDDFSMRKLAGRLGVNPMTVYLRFDSKDELLDAVVAEALTGIEAPDATGSWDERVLAWADSIRTHLLAARHLLPLMQSSRHLAASMVAAADMGLHLMAERADGDDEAIAGFRMLFWHAIGAALAHEAMVQQSPTDTLRSAVDLGLDPASPAAMMLSTRNDLDPDGLFATSTRALIAGMGLGPQ